MELIVPTLGESITEATVSKWLKKVGDSFEADEPLVEIETDKITVEVPAPSAGSISEIKVEEGVDVNIGGVLALLGDKKTSNDTAKNEEVITEQPNQEQPKETKVEENIASSNNKDSHKLSPSVKKLIAENDTADTELFGRAYNALGDCLQRSNKPKDALMAYLHVDILFYGDSETHAEALYQLSKLWQVAKNQDRAAVAGNLLKQRYAGSVWAAKQ